MEWYIPITILPGVGMMILSTSNILISLNDEIRELNGEKEKYKSITSAKIKQLKRLNYALIVQYISAFLFVTGGVIGGVIKNDKPTIYLVFLGVVLLATSIILLIKYSLKSLIIRQKHLTI